MSYARLPRAVVSMTLGMSAMGLSSLTIYDESDAPPRRCRLSGGEIQTEVGDTPERVRTKAGGGDAQLHPRVVRPAALLLDRLAAAELPSQVQIEVGDRELQRGRKRDQLLGRDVLESALDFGKIGGREARRPGDFRQGALGLVAPPPEKGAEGGANRIRIFALSVGHMPSA